MSAAEEIDDRLARIAAVAAAIEDPCDDGGYDQFCRDSHGALCPFHVEHFRPPDYPCIDLLRASLARQYIVQIDARRAGQSR